MFVFLFSDSRIVSHSPFACNWQTRFLDSQPIISRFPSNTPRTSNLQIPHNSTKLHLAPCMRIVFCVCRLGPSHTSKQNFLSLILLIPLAKLMNQKRGICRHRILYPLRFGPPFSNDAQTLRPRDSLEPNQISK